MSFLCDFFPPQPWKGTTDLVQRKPDVVSGKQQLPQPGSQRPCLLSDLSPLLQGEKYGLEPLGESGSVLSVRQLDTEDAGGEQAVTV